MMWVRTRIRNSTGWGASPGPPGLTKSVSVAFRAHGVVVGRCRAQQAVQGSLQK